MYCFGDLMGAFCNETLCESWFKSGAVALFEGSQTKIGFTLMYLYIIGHSVTFALLGSDVRGSLGVPGGVEVVDWQARSVCAKCGMDRGNGGGDMSRAKV